MKAIKVPQVPVPPPVEIQLTMSLEEAQALKLIVTRTVVWCESGELGKILQNANTELTRAGVNYADTPFEAQLVKKNLVSELK